MQVIQFPGTPVNKSVTVQTSIDPANKMVIGPMRFTCTSCNAEVGADFRKMIFRSVEFHCAGCGTYFKISNPGFAVAPQPTR